HPFTLTAAKRYAPRRSALCGTFPEACPREGTNSAGRYPAPYVHGARTFLPGDLSVLAGAAVRPTDALGMGVWAAPVKGRFRGDNQLINGGCYAHNGSRFVDRVIHGRPGQFRAHAVLHRTPRPLDRRSKAAGAGTQDPG